MNVKYFSDCEMYSVGLAVGWLFDKAEGKVSYPTLQQSQQHTRLNECTSKRNATHVVPCLYRVALCQKARQPLHPCCSLFFYPFKIFYFKKENNKTAKNFKKYTGCLHSSAESRLLLQNTGHSKIVLSTPLATTFIYTVECNLKPL